MSTVHDLFIGGHIKPLAHSPLDLSELDESHSGIKHQLSIGAHVLTLDDPDALLNVMCPSFLFFSFLFFFLCLILGKLTMS